MATTTYVPIETYTIDSDTTSITFGSGNTLPQTYTDLVIVINASSNHGDNGSRGYIQFNGDTNNNYADVWFGGDGSNPASNKDTPQSSIAYGVIGNATSPFTTQIINVMNYANNSTTKTVLSRSSNPNAAGNYGLRLTYGYWNNTAAITSISLKCDSQYRSGSTFTIYGIANADSGAKATGGVITYDDTYYYHTFGTSGTFTPQQNLTNVDYLVIAGGGGGSASGAGAGGLRTTVGSNTGGGGTIESKISLTSGTAYTITVGAGGAGSSNGQTTAGSNGANSSISGSGLTTITSIGGGAGAQGGAGAVNGISGGSGSGGFVGGGGIGQIGYGGSGTTNQGYAGGNTSVGESSQSSTGSGGGAGGAGQVGTKLVGATGGIGMSIPDIANATGTGVATYYAGGGGSAIYDTGNTAGAGGLGGGGNAASNTVAGSSGVANTGGGAGGFYSSNYYTAAYNGGSGVVVIRYAKA